MRILLLAIIALVVTASPAACQGAQIAVFDLHDFTGGSDGFSPDSTLVESSPGVFLGGSAGYTPSGGSIFSITSAGVFNPLYELLASQDGEQPVGQLFPSSNGLFYGVTIGSGPNNNGTIFAASAGGSFSVIQASVNVPTPLLEGSDGNFYGIDGNYDGAAGAPIFFKISPNGQKTTLGNFPAATSVSGALVQASDGNFYGSTAAPNGTVFRFSPDGKYTLVHQFQNTEIYSQLAQGSNGLLYGATFTPASVCGTEQGVVFSLSLSGQVTVLHEFACSPHGSGAVSGLVQASDGYLYGTCPYCGTGSGGSVYRLAIDGSGFADEADLTRAEFRTPGAGVIQGSDGIFYGIAPGGGRNDLGFIFSLSVGAPPPLPTLSYARPASAEPGATALIRGANLLAASQVTFNGLLATFAVKSVDYIAATVPVGASSGPISVTTPNGTGTSGFSFTVD